MRAGASRTYSSGCRYAHEAHAFEHHRQALADADADRGDAVAAAAARAARGRARPRIRAPDAPSGWPIAIAPPSTLTLLGVELRPLGQAGQRLRGERLVELDDVDVVPADAGARAAPCWPPRPARCRTRRGRRRARARDDDPRQRLAPSRAPPASSPISSAPAPSLSGEELPAVTVPSVRERGLELGELLERGVGADRTRRARARCRARARPRRRRRPASHAAAASWWLRSANASCVLARDVVACSASFSALSPSEIVHCSGICGLTIRQPSVVECSVSWPRREALLGLEQHPRRAAHRLDAAGDDDVARRRPRSRGWPGSPPPGSSRTAG